MSALDARHQVFLSGVFCGVNGTIAAPIQGRRVSGVRDQRMLLAEMLIADNCAQTSGLCAGPAEV